MLCCLYTSNYYTFCCVFSFSYQLEDGACDRVFMACTLLNPFGALFLFLLFLFGYIQPLLASPRSSPNFIKQFFDGHIFRLKVRVSLFNGARAICWCIWIERN